MFIFRDGIPQLEMLAGALVALQHIRHYPMSRLQAAFLWMQAAIHAADDAAVMLITRRATGCRRQSWEFVIVQRHVSDPVAKDGLHCRAEALLLLLRLKSLSPGFFIFRLNVAPLTGDVPEQTKLLTSG
jgi:hypothetical protein